MKKLTGKGTVLKPATFCSSTSKMSRVISNYSNSVARARHMYGTTAVCQRSTTAASALPPESFWAVRLNLPFLQVHFEEHNIYALKILISVLGPYVNCEKRLVASSSLSVRLSARNNSAPTGRIFMKFYISVSFEKVSRKFKVH
jgi:hypothetical protein